jgi:hypothetical protein
MGATACTSCEPGKYAVEEDRSSSASLTCSGNCDCKPLSSVKRGNFTNDERDDAYPRNLNCGWTISGEFHPTNPTTEISLTFSEFDVQYQSQYSSYNDYIYVYSCAEKTCDSSGRVLLGRMSSGCTQDCTNPQNTFTSTTGFMKVVFTSNSLYDTTRSDLTASYRIRSPFTK